MAQPPLPAHVQRAALLPGLVRGRAYLAFQSDRGGDEAISWQRAETDRGDTLAPPIHVVIDWFDDLQALAPVR